MAFVYFKKKSGDIVRVPEESEDAAIKSGYEYASEQEADSLDKQLKLESEASDIGSTVGLIGESLLRGVSYGVSPAIEVGIGKAAGAFADIMPKGEAPEFLTSLKESLSPEAINAREEANPYLSTGFEIAGAVIPAVASLGSTALAGTGLKGTAKALEILGKADIGSPVTEYVTKKLLGKAVMGELPQAAKYTEKLIEERLLDAGTKGFKQIAKKAAAIAAGGAAEGALQGVGDTLGEAALENTELTAENLASNAAFGAGAGALIGGILGFGVPYSVQGLRLTTNLVKEGIDKVSKKTIPILGELGTDIPAGDIVKVIEAGPIAKVADVGEEFEKNKNDLVETLGKDVQDSFDNLDNSISELRQTVDGDTLEKIVQDETKKNYELLAKQWETEDLADPNLSEIAFQKEIFNAEKPEYKGVESLYREADELGQVLNNNRTQEKIANFEQLGEALQKHNFQRLNLFIEKEVVPEEFIRTAKILEEEISLLAAEKSAPQPQGKFEVLSGQAEVQPLSEIAANVYTLQKGIKEIAASVTEAAKRDTIPKNIKYFEQLQTAFKDIENGLNNLLKDKDISSYISKLEEAKTSRDLNINEISAIKFADEIEPLLYKAPDDFNFQTEIKKLTDIQDNANEFIANYYDRPSTISAIEDIDMNTVLFPSRKLKKEVKNAGDILENLVKEDEATLRNVPTSNIPGLGDMKKISPLESTRNSLKYILKKFENITSNMDNDKFVRVYSEIKDLINRESEAIRLIPSMENIDVSREQAIVDSLIEKFNKFEQEAGVDKVFGPLASVESLSRKIDERIGSLYSVSDGITQLKKELQDKVKSGAIPEYDTIRQKLVDAIMTKKDGKDVIDVQKLRKLIEGNDLKVIEDFNKYAMDFLEGHGAIKEGDVAIPEDLSEVYSLIVKKAEEISPQVSELENISTKLKEREEKMFGLGSIFGKGGLGALFGANVFGGAIPGFMLGALWGTIRDPGDAIKKLDFFDKAMNKVINNTRKSSEWFIKTTTTPASITSKAVRNAVMQDNKKDNRKAYKEQTQKIISLLSNPETLAEEMSIKYKDIQDLMPKITQKAEQSESKAIQFLGTKIPKQPDNWSSNLDWEPSDAQINKFLKYSRYIKDPNAFLGDVTNLGYVPEEGLETIKTVYPEIFTNIVTSLAEVMADAKEKKIKIPDSKMALIKKIYGMPVDQASLKRNQEVMVLKSKGPTGNVSKAPDRELTQTQRLSR